MADIKQIKIENTTYDIHAKTADTAINDGLGNNIGNTYATKTAVSTQINNAISNIQIYSYGATAPNDTKLLWIDSSSGGVLKYYNGSAWTAIKSVWG